MRAGVAFFPFLDFMVAAFRAADFHGFLFFVRRFHLFRRRRHDVIKFLAIAADDRGEGGVLPAGDFGMVVARRADVSE